MPVVLEFPSRTEPYSPDTDPAAVTQLESLLGEASRRLIAIVAKLMVFGGGTGHRHARAGRQELPELLAELIAFCEDHFRHEEAVMRAAGLNGFDRIWQAHTSAHAELMRGFSLAAGRVAHDAPHELVERVVALVEQFWSAHHVEHDRLACDVLRQKLAMEGRYALQP